MSKWEDLSTSTWNEVRLGEVTEINARNTPTDYKGTILYVDISSVSSGLIKGYTEYEYREAPSRARRVIREDDIIYSTVRPNLKAFYKFKKDISNNIVASTGFVVLSKKRGTSIDYIYYLMTSNSVVDYLTLIAKGAAYPAVSVDDFKNLKIQIPDLKTQEKIADILSTYDELIENNNRRIEILEKAAEEIYKEWFVRLRFPGYENSKLINGIPEGWEVRKVSELISFDIGGGWGKDIIEGEFTEKAFVIRGTDIPNMKYGNYNYENLRFHKKSNLKNRKLKDGDIIFEVSGGSTYQRLGRTIFITEELLSMYDEDVICASFCKLIRINDNYLSWFFNNYLNYAYKTEKLSTFEVQSTGISNFGFVNFKKHHRILVPTENLLKNFYYLTYDMHIAINKLQKQNQNLIKQRDLLLPRLMNGTIEVK